MKVAFAKFYPAHPNNYTEGRGGQSVKHITIHHTAGFEESLKPLYENPNRRGSAHFFVHPEKIEQYVDTDDMAWTNGNYKSNQVSITIEVRGLWQNGYKDDKTLAQLAKLLAELRRIYPNATMTYHMDESDTPTACPADLKHKGYALEAWNGGTDMATPKEIDTAITRMHINAFGKPASDEVFKDRRRLFESKGYVAATLQTMNEYEKHPDALKNKKSVIGTILKPGTYKVN